MDRRTIARAAFGVIGGGLDWDHEDAGIARLESFDVADSILSALEARGYCIAPLEATEEMIGAVKMACINAVVERANNGQHTYLPYRDKHRLRYRAMIQARPKGD